MSEPPTPTKPPTPSDAPTLTESSIRELARSKSFDKGESYYERGAVGTVVSRGNLLRGDVRGSQPRPYSVTIEFDEAGVAATDCSCPYDHGGICKHRVAVLLTYVRDSDRIIHEQPISDRIARADQETLEDVLVELVESRPELAQWIETRLQTSEVADESATSTTVSVNLDSIRRQGEHALPKPGQRGHNDAYAEARRMAEELDELLEQARLALDTGDGDTALDVLEVLTDVLLNNRWTGLLPHDVPELFDTIEDLGKLFVEAVLAADLDEAERNDWEQRFSEWDDDSTFRHFVGRSVFRSAADAVKEGWEDEHVQQAMQGGFDHGEFRAGATGWLSETVIDARLRILEKQGRIDEYLNLSLATGNDPAHATTLVDEGRIEDAVEYGIEYLSTPGSLLELAKTLRKDGHRAEAFTVAEHGLTVDGYGRGDLAKWLRDRASSAGDDGLVLEAAITAFEEGPSVSAYQTAEGIAGEDWERVREDLLAFVRRNPKRYVSGSVEVLLYEELYDEAIEHAEAAGGSTIIKSVVETVTDQRPEWAIEACKAQAEPIIENGKHDRYRTAVRWLERAGTVAKEADRGEEWREYVEGIRDEHYRKYKLRPMLDELLEEF